MRTFVSGLLVVVLALMLGAAVLAQDTSQQGDTAGQGGDIMCDSDMMLNLYIADRFFGFDRFQTDLAATATDPSQALDLSRYNQGQFGPLFEGFSAMQGTAGQTGDTSNQSGDTSSQAGQGQTSFGFNY